LLHSPPTHVIPYPTLFRSSEAALDSNSVRIGAYTSAADVIGRHAYEALVYVPTDNSGVTGSLYYRNASLGQPLVEIVASQDWEKDRKSTRLNSSHRTI